MNLKNLTDMFGIRKQLWKELTMLEATVKELASHTKEQIDGLRNDMAAEFVKRDKDIDLHWGKIQNVGFEFDHFKLQEEAARHRFEGAVTEKNKNLKEDLADLQKLFQSWVGDLSGIDKRLKDFEKHLKDIEEYVSMQTDSIAAIILACGLREGNKFVDAYEQIKRERADLKKIIDQAKEKHEAPKAEPSLEAEETLFSDLEKKKRNKRLVAPHPGMKQLRSWALHYGMTQREFSWGMSRLGYPIRKSEGARNRDIGSCWLYPDEAKRIYVEIKDQR